jgi:hypothetical protein
MKRHLLAVFMSLVVGGVSLADAADLSRAGGDWDEESSFEWVPAKLASFLPSMETESPSLIEQAGAVEDISTETSFVNHQRGCCTGIPCDWLTPCGGWTFEIQAAWLRLQGSEASRDHSGDRYESATRYIFGHTDECGKSWRLRYFNYATDNTGNNFRPLKFEYADIERARRFTLGGSVYGELGAGLRWAEYYEAFPNDNQYSSTIGPMIAAEIRGVSFAGFEAYAAARHSIQFGKPDNKISFGSFSITELQLGLNRNVDILGHPSFVKGFLESQRWTGIADGADGADLGLVGLGFALGTTF